MVIVGPYTDTPLAVRLEPGGKGQETLNSQIALMRQNGATGAKLFFSSELSPDGKLTPRGTVLLETYRDGREDVGVVLSVEGNKARTSNVETFTYRTPYPNIVQGIPYRERMRAFHSEDLEAATGPENEPGATKEMLNQPDLVATYSFPKLLEYFSRENRGRDSVTLEAIIKYAQETA